MSHNYNPYKPPNDRQVRDIWTMLVLGAFIVTIFACGYGIQELIR